MSNSTIYLNFSAIDYKGLDTLSSYSLENTPLTFIADLGITENPRVVWNFGDGTTSNYLSASKWYKYPGLYNVNLIIYDCDNNAQISSFEKIITIQDFIPFTFDIDVSQYSLSSNIDIECGVISGPFFARSTYPTYQPTSNIFYNIKNSNSSNYWNLDNKYSHLQSFNTLYDKFYNYSLSGYQYREVEFLDMINESDNIYAKIDGDSIIGCEKDAIGSFYIGTSAIKEFFIKDDSITDRIDINFNFDRTNNNFSGRNNEHYNNLGITLSARVVNNTPTHLSITSNGMDGEGYTVESFNITSIKYYNTKIPFIVKIKDVDNFSVKNFNSLQLSSFNISLNINTNLYNVEPLNDTLSSIDHGGAYRGYLYFSNVSSNDILSGVRISASGIFTNDLLSSYNLSGVSNSFNVYPLNYFDLYKNNENFNAEQTIKDLRFQETLLDKEVLFGDFIGGVLGRSEGKHEDIGLKLYEKISNFAKNTQDLDMCEVDSLNSLGDMVGYTGLGDEKWQFPDKIKRLVNLLSVDKNKLFGTTNKFQENLDIKGRTSKEEFGRNIGNRIDTKTYIISAGTDIIALEKFSNTYTKLNTYQPLSSVGISVYPLSSYDSDWGWPLVLPSLFNFSDIEKYYLFFEYDDVYDNTITDGLIDFDNINTTISIDTTDFELKKNNGIYDNILLSTLYDSLSLF